MGLIKYIFIYSISDFAYIKMHIIIILYINNELYNLPDNLEFPHWD